MATVADAAVKELSRAGWHIIKVDQDDEGRERRWLVEHRTHTVKRPQRLWLDACDLLKLGLGLVKLDK